MPDLLLNKGLPFWVAFIATIFAAAIVGVLNGLLISRVKINPLITTLGTLGLARGLAEILSQGTIVAPTDQTAIPEWFSGLGSNSVAGIPVLLVVPVVLVAVGDILLRRGLFFREVFFLGGSERAARFAGIRVSYVQMNVYLLSALLAAIAGLLLDARFQSATSNYGTGYELQAIAAAVIGGAALSGGVGSLTGTLLATILLALVQDAIILNSVSPYWQDFITGGILIVAVGLTLHGRRGGDLRQLVAMVARRREKTPTRDP